MTTFSLYCQYIGEIKRSMSRDEKLTSYSLGEGVRVPKVYVIRHRLFHVNKKVNMFAGKWQ